MCFTVDVPTVEKVRITDTPAVGGLGPASLGPYAGLKPTTVPAATVGVFDPALSDVRETNSKVHPGMKYLLHDRPGGGPPVGTPPLILELVKAPPV